LDSADLAFSSLATTLLNSERGSRPEFGDLFLRGALLKGTIVKIEKARIPQVKVRIEKISSIQ